MTKAHDAREARLAKVADLRRAGLSAEAIGARTGRSKAAVQGDMALLQARGAIKKRVVHRVRPATGRSSLADLARQGATYRSEFATLSHAKRVVTVTRSHSEVRAIRFFGDCAEAMAAPRASITGVCDGAVVRDVVFMRDRQRNSWAVWQVLEGVAA